MSAQTEERLAALFGGSVQHTPSGTLGGMERGPESNTRVRTTEVPRQALPDFSPSVYDCPMPTPETSRSGRPLARAEVSADPVNMGDLWEREQAFQDFLARTEDLPQAPPLIIKGH